MDVNKNYCQSCGREMGYSPYAPISTCSPCRNKERKESGQAEKQEKANIRLAAARKYALQNNISLSEALALITT